MAKFDYSVKFKVDGLSNFYAAIDAAVKKVEELEKSFKQAFQSLSIDIPTVSAPQSTAIARTANDCNPCDSIDNLAGQVVPRIDEIISLLRAKSLREQQLERPSSARNQAEQIRQRSLMPEAIRVKVEPILQATTRLIADKQQRLLPPSQQQLLTQVQRQALPPGSRGGDLAIQPETQRRFARKALPPASEKAELGFESIVAKLAEQGKERQSSQRKMIAALDEALAQYQSGEDDLLPVIDQLVARLRGPQIPAALKK
ncbi:MAG: hypothetical protein HC840_04920, partial [Leptolyngbyaceae cyanobacterium RM2_2_4]|nr:hypothetical protein [Leptolyngbyaceae cyanobacterium RM2_2_4]